MGSENSTHAISGDVEQPIEVPLVFHETHSKNVLVDSSDRTLAKRQKGYNDGICFGSRPVGVNEKIHIHLCSSTKDWSGSVRLGFTSIDPRKLSSDSLPTNTCPDLIKKQGYYASAVKENYSKPDDKLYFFYGPNGTVNYGCNGRELGVLFKPVPADRKLWPIIDIYGSTNGVRILNSAGSSNENNESVLSPNYKLKFYGCLSLEPMKFHRNLGDNLQIYCNYSLVKQRSYQEYGNLVFTYEKLHPNLMWIGVVAGVDFRSQSKLRIGVTNCDPGTLSSPVSINCNFGRKYKTECFINYAHPKIGDEIALCVTKTGFLQVALNGEAFSTVIQNINTETDLWGFLDLGQVSQLRSCGYFMVEKSFLPSLPDIDNEESDKPTRVVTKTDRIAEPVEAAPINKDEDNLCGICFDKDRDTAFDPCGHLAACFECSQNVFNNTKKCPICRKAIAKYIKIYFA